MFVQSAADFHSCLSGCSCTSSVLNAHISDHVSPVCLHKVQVTQSYACILSVLVLAESNSGEHKIKVGAWSDQLLVTFYWLQKNVQF